MARGYVKGILRKLGGHSRLRALIYAARWGFVEICALAPADSEHQ